MKPLTCFVVFRRQWQGDRDAVVWMASFATQLFPFGRMEAGDGHTLFPAEQFDSRAMDRSFKFILMRGWICVYP
jgi:hypothetical protein